MIIRTMPTAAALDDLNIKVQGDWFRSVFDCLNDAVFIHDVVTGAILEVNQRACEMYGCGPDEMRRLSMAALSVNTPPYALEDSLQWMRKAIEEGGYAEDTRLVADTAEQVVVAQSLALLRSVYESRRTA